MRYGLSDDAVARITCALAHFPDVEKAVIYGSRAEGNYRKGSDIDLVLFGGGLTDDIVSRIYWALDDLSLPYKIDLSLFSRLKHPALIEHIHRVGIVLYTRERETARR